MNRRRCARSLSRGVELVSMRVRPVLILAFAASTVLFAPGAAAGTGSGGTVDRDGPADSDEVPGPVVEVAVGAVGLVRSAGGLGSGWVARDNTVITNLHVAKGGTGDIYMDFSDGERIECYTAVGDREMDLAVLRCATGDRTGFGIDTSIPPADEPVAIVGYPRGEGPTTTQGVITGDRRDVRGIETVGFTAAIAPGSSGSPVFDSKGQVRAVATFGGGLGVPIDALVPLLDTAEGYPSTKAAAEWRLRGRRSVIAVLLVGPLGWFLARRNGRNAPVGIAARWSVAALILALALTQAQFAMSGPAHFL